MNYNVPESKIRIGIEKKEIINSYIVDFKIDIFLSDNIIYKRFRRSLKHFIKN